MKEKARQFRRKINGVDNSETRDLRMKELNDRFYYNQVDDASNKNNAKHRLKRMVMNYKHYLKLKKQKIKNPRQFFTDEEWEYVLDALHAKKVGVDILKMGKNQRDRDAERLEAKLPA
jgi:hypothetical protein